MAGRHRFGEDSHQRCARLKELGQWTEFKDRRRALKDDGGTSGQADWQAWGEYPPADAPTEIAPTALKEAPKPPPEPVATPEPAPDLVAAVEKVAATLAPPAPKGKPRKLPMLVPASTFTGKPRVTDRKALKWALDHVAIADVSEADCPSANAWFFLTHMRSNPEFAEKLALQFAPTRAEGAKESRYHDDGRDLNERLAKIRQRADALDGALPVLCGSAQGKA